MSAPLVPPFQDWPQVPYVGVGCIVEFEGRLLLVRDRRGLWSTPGGHLDFGESPVSCAARETKEETGVIVTNVDFVAITNDLLNDVGKHYLTVWMRADPKSSICAIEDTSEIDRVGWFSPEAMPGDLHKFFLNLIAGRCMPERPSNFPKVLTKLRHAHRVA